MDTGVFLHNTHCIKLQGRNNKTLQALTKKPNQQGLLQYAELLKACNDLLHVATHVPSELWTDFILRRSAIIDCIQCGNGVVQGNTGNPDEGWQADAPLVVLQDVGGRYMTNNTDLM